MNTGKLERETGSSGIRIRINGQEIQCPVLRVLIVVLGLGIAAAAVTFAFLLVGLTLGLTLGIILLVLLLLFGGIPLLVLGALILRVLLYPIRAIMRSFGRRLKN